MEDVAMRDFDFAPLIRSAIGFERMMQLLDDLPRVGPGDGYPPYDIEKIGEDAWRITMAVAGFAPDSLSVTQEKAQLIVAGAKEDEAGDTAERYLYRGIPTSRFERRFDLAEFVEVTGAEIADGLLIIDLVRNVPEPMKPRRIEITTGAAPPNPGESKSNNFGKQAA
jgi:molecular chaperone IbpA